MKRIWTAGWGQESWEYRAEGEASSGWGESEKFLESTRLSFAQGLTGSPLCARHYVRVWLGGVCVAGCIGPQWTRVMVPASKADSNHDEGHTHLTRGLLGGHLQSPCQLWRLALGYNNDTHPRCLSKSTLYTTLGNLIPTWSSLPHLQLAELQDLKTSES